MTPASTESLPQVLPPYIETREDQFSFLMGEDFVEKHNIAWRVEIAQEDAANPILDPRYPWESAGVFSYGTVLHDPMDGLWKMWYIAIPEHEMSPSALRRLCYAESKDGLNWERPELDICPYPGYDRTNILIDIPSGGSCQHASVILHPDAPEDQRYEMFVLRFPGWECDYNVVEGFPLPPGQQSHKHADFAVGFYRYISSDGKRWRPWEQVRIPTADGGWVLQQPDGSYVMYHKIAIPALPGSVVPYDVAAGRTRILMRRTSPDGSAWSEAELMMVPDWQDAHDTQFMEIAPKTQKNGYVGMLCVYHNLNQTVDIQFAGSRDGKSWWRPDRRACLPLRPLGDIGGGMIWPMLPLIHHEGRVYFYYSGCEGVHNDYMGTEPLERMRAANLPFWPHYYQALPNGNDLFSPVPGNLWYYASICRCSWEEGRLWAAVTASGGKLTGDMLTRPLEAGGKEITVNVLTVKDGTLEAELVSEGKPIAGFTRADCTPIEGDQRAAILQWKGGTVCPVDKVQIRFFIRRARLYSFDLADND